MPVGAAIGGGAIVSGYLGAEASEDASYAASQSAANSIAEQRRQFDLTRGDTAPYRETGQDALSQLAKLFGLPGRQMTSTASEMPVNSVSGTSTIGNAQSNQTWEDFLEKNYFSRGLNPFEGYAGTKPTLEEALRDRN